MRLWAVVLTWNEIVRAEEEPSEEEDYRQLMALKIPVENQLFMHQHQKKGSPTSGKPFCFKTA
jgi:hypothetical protein